MSGDRRGPQPRVSRAARWLSALGDRLGYLLIRRGDLPPATLRRSVGAGDFRLVGAEFLGHFRELGELRPDERVLEVGCGVGRMALPLAGYLNESGTYDGIDIVPKAIRWCRRNISTRHPGFRFHLAPVFSSVYNPRGTIPAERYSFPFADHSFDFALLTSVFTHLQALETDRYLAELFRVLRPGGRLFSTWFLLNDQVEEMIRERGTTRPFSMDYGTYRTLPDELPGTAVAYPEESMRSFLERYGFHIREPLHYGKWCGRADGTSFQDIVVADRGASDAAPPPTQ